MSHRNQVVLADVVSGVFNAKTGVTMRLYKYDGGQPNNRGVLVGTLTEFPAGSAQYYIDISGHSFKGVLTVDDGTELNIPAYEGKYFRGDNPALGEVNTDSIATGAVTAEKTDFLYE